MLKALAELGKDLVGGRGAPRRQTIRHRHSDPKKQQGVAYDAKRLCLANRFEVGQVLRSSTCALVADEGSPSK